MKNADLKRLHAGLQACGGFTGGFGYVVAKNTRQARIVLIDLEKTIEQDDDYKAFDKNRMVLCEEHAVRDDRGKVEMDERNQFVMRDARAFEIAFADLKKSDAHKEAVDRYQEKLDVYNKLMREGEADYTPHMISESRVPFDDLTAVQLEGILDIIEQDGLAPQESPPDEGSGQ